MAAGSQLSLLCCAELAGGLLPSLYLLQERSGIGVRNCPGLLRAFGGTGSLVGTEGAPAWYPGGSIQPF